MTIATITSSAGRFTGKIVDCLNWDAATRGERAILHVPCCRTYRLDSLIGLDQPIASTSAKRDAFQPTANRWA